MKYFKNLENPKNCLIQSTTDLQKAVGFIEGSLVYPRLAAQGEEYSLVWVCYIDKEPITFHYAFEDQPLLEGRIALIGGNGENDFFDGYIFEHNQIPHQIIFNEFCGHKIMALKMLQDEQEVRKLIDKYYRLKNYIVYIAKIRNIPIWFVESSGENLILPIFYQDINELDNFGENPKEQIIFYKTTEIIKYENKRYKIKKRISGLFLEVALDN